MRVVDFVNTLRQLVEEKINECKGEIHESHNPVYNNSMLVDIQTLEWVLGQINYLENKEKKNWESRKE
jgi:hypothetical protein